jgi:hypothetical protein
MNPARRVLEKATMRASRRVRARQQDRRPRRRAGARKLAPNRPANSVIKLAPAVPRQVLFRLCKPGWALIVEQAPNSLGTRFVCPFCPSSHRVPGPVRGFRKVRRAQWIKLHRVGE